jgi:hypothetical protein
MAPARTCNSSLALVAGGILCLFASLHLQRAQTLHSGSNIQIQKFPIHATASFGHREFAWTLIAIESLAATVNAWNSRNNPNIDESRQARMQQKFDESLEGLAGIAEFSLGMREVFTFPASFLAFELNDLDRAIAVARAGAKDFRLEADLALSIAFLTHIFKGDLRAAADDYERVSVHFPEAVWLKETVNSLRQGIDPSKRAGKDKTILCKMLANAFPLAKKKLVQRNLCSLNQISGGTGQ